MVRLLRMIGIGVFVFLFSTASAFAMPQFFALLKADPYIRVQPPNCSACHMSPTGGDARNPFGQAFEAAGTTITPLLRAQFPDRFGYPTSKVSDTLTVHFSDPNNKVVVLESGGKMTVVDVEKKTVDGKPAATAPTATADATPSAPVPAAEIPVDPYAHEGAFFGGMDVDLATPQPIQRGGVDVRVNHRFTEQLFQTNAPRDFLGFDSGAFITFGARVGLTNRLSYYAYRTNDRRFIEMGLAQQITRQGGRSPLSLQFRAGAEGQNNFSQHYTGYVEALSEHTFMNRVSLLFDPILAMNTRSENEAVNPATFRQFGTDRNATLALGTGLGIRVLPTVSVVTEYIPRVWGYQGVAPLNIAQGGDMSRPTVSLGIQKATARHTFELLMTTSEMATTNEYAVSGTDKFRIGFNIYRKVK